MKKEDTDESLKALWEEAEARWKQIAAGQLPPGYHDARDADRDVLARFGNLRERWEKLAALKRCHRLTNPRKVEAVGKVVTDLMRLAGFPVKCWREADARDESEMKPGSRSGR